MGIRPRITVSAVAAIAVAAAAGVASAGRPRVSEPVGFQLFESPQANPIALSSSGSELYVAHTTANVVGVIDTTLNWEIAQIPVGLDPVSVAVRPPGTELWVSNHVSDTVSVIDIDPNSPTRYRVIDTIQSIDANQVTLFDEPVGIAFTADGSRAFVALSSRNQIAVIDANARTVTNSINVRAQEPRALAVSNGRLFVASFESGNQTQLSACGTLNTPTPPCTLNIQSLTTFAQNPNLPGSVKNIIVDTVNPDRDLFVYDVSTLAEKAVVNGIGTLLYGVAVTPTSASSERVFITETDARNQVNGNDGQFLVGLGNRMFLNRVAAVNCTTSGSTTTCDAAATQLDLEPSPSQASALATPYGVAVSGDGSTVVVTAAASSRVATIKSTTGGGGAPQLQLLGMANVSSSAPGAQIPRGIALLSNGAGAPQTAYVLNTLDNSVTPVAVSANAAPVVSATRIGLFGDLTPAAVRRGRVVFNSAFASTTGTFSCASCHPDGNTDQLLWRIGGACSSSIGCTPGDEPRTTMPVRGLKNTLPLHWDGTLGDPFGGGNGAVGLNGNGGTDCTLTQGPGGDHACFRDLVNASNSGVMCDQTGSCPSGGLLLTEQQKDDEATYLASVSYPPARSRRMTDVLSPAGSVNVPNGDGSPSSPAVTAGAMRGFKDFFIDQGGNATNPDTCADSNAGCHTLPLMTGTNSATLNGFDVPTMRGMTDRFVQFSLAPTAPEGILTFANTGLALPPPNTISPLETPIKWNVNQGMREITTFGAAFAIFQPVYNVRPLNIFQMFEEANTMGFSGAQARQVELNVRTTAGANLTDVNNWLTTLETADARGLVNLRADGVRNGFQVGLSFANGTYTEDYGSYSLTRSQLISEAQAGTTILAITAELRSNWGTDNGPQPLLGLATTGSNGVTGDPPLPVIACSGSPCVAADPPPITLVGTDVRTNATLFIDGQPATGTITCSLGTFGAFCVNGNISVDISQSLQAGLHLLQVQNPAGPLSEELPVCVGTKTNCNS